MFGAFLGVELRRENIIARNGAREALAVVGLAHAVACIRRLCVITVHKVEVGAVGTSPHTGCRVSPVCQTWFQPIWGTL